MADDFLDEDAADPTDTAFLDEADGDVVADLGSDDQQPASDSDMDEAADGEASSEPPVPDQSAQCLQAHSEPVYAVAGHAATGRFATGGGDDRAFLWSLQQDGSLAPTELAGHGDSVAAVGFSSDGALLATAGMDGKVLVWRTADAALERTLEGPGEAVDWLQWHPRGAVLLAGSEDFTAWLWNAADGACMQVFSGHSGAVTCGAFTPDGRSICTGSADMSLRQWNPRTGECVLTIQGHQFHDAPLTSLDIHPGGAMAMTGGEDATSRLVSLATGKVVGALRGHQDSVECVGLCDGLPFAVSGSLDGTAILWDVHSLSVRHTCAHEAAVTSLRWVPGTCTFYSGCGAGKLRLWDGRTGLCVRTLTGHHDAILDLWASPDGRQVITSSDDGTARVFHVV